MKEVINKLADTKISTSYLFILLGVCALMMSGYFSYAWFTVQGVQQYSVVTGNLSGSITIGANSVAIEGAGTISYTPATDSETVTITVTNSSDRTVKNSIYYYTLSDSSIEIGYTSDSPAVPLVTGISLEKGKTLNYKIKINGSKGKAVKIGSSMGLVNSDLTLPTGTSAFEQLNDPLVTEYLLSKANAVAVDYSTATDEQKNQMLAFSHEATDQTDALTDYRYIGANPNNYVKFNDELWRIVGIFDTDDGTGKVEKRLKIVRNESIITYSLDSKNTTTATSVLNDWRSAKLNYLLNPEHDSETYGGSLYWNRKSGTCYSSQTGTTPCDFTSTGLTEDAKKMITDTKWYLGGTNLSTTSSAADFYKAERGLTVSTDSNTSWTGKIGLIYPSDYKYASSADDASKENDWLAFGSENLLTMTPYSDSSFAVYGITAGVVSYDVTTPYNVHPVVNLSSTVKVVSGTGSKDSPYILAQ